MAIFFSTYRFAPIAAVLCMAGEFAISAQPGWLDAQSSMESSCKSWHRYALQISPLILSNNTWGSGQVNRRGWQQCVYATRRGAGYELPVGWTYNWLDESDGEQSAVKAYPEVIYGNKFGTEISGSKRVTGLPETLGKLPEIEVTYSYSETGDTDRELNVTAESFLHETCDITGPGNRSGDNRVFEMMVWVQAGIKRPHRRPLTEAIIDGVTWNVYANPKKSSSYIAFILPQPMTEGSLDWNSFIQWTRANAPQIGLDQLQDTWCLGSIEFGTEVWWGKGEFVLNRFEVKLGD